MQKMMRPIFSSFVSLVCLCVLMAPPALAWPAAEHIAVILIMDNSGSMKTSDPDGLRITGARLFASLLDSGDSLGLVVFSTASQRLTDRLIRLGSKAEVSGFLAGMNIPPADGFTDVKAALEDARLLQAATDLPNDRTFIVLLTDGKPEIQNPYSEYEQETLELARSLNIPILAIALTSAAQIPFLDRLAAVTKGAVIPADDASDILGAYLQILGQVKDRTVIGGESFSAQTELEIEPALAPYVHSATFIVVKPGDATVQLVGPGGYEIVQENTSDSYFSIFALENPAGGGYSARLQGGGAAQVWAILRSKLRVRVKEPTHVHPAGRDMPIVVYLLEETPDGNFILINGEADFTALVIAPDGQQISLDRFYDDGTHGDAVAGDGDYTRLLPNPNLSGTYQIFVQGWKSAVPVQGETWVTVQKFPELVVELPQKTMEVRGEPVGLRVQLEPPTFFDQGEIVAQITSPSGGVEEVVLRQKSQGYEGQFLPPEGGIHSVWFATRGVRFLGVEYQTQVEHVFAVDLIPTATVILESVDIASACLPSAHEYTLLMSVAATNSETLHFSAPGWVIKPEVVHLKQGEQSVTLQLHPIQAPTSAVEYVEIQIEGSGRLEVQPDPTIRAELQIPGLYARCRTPINLGVVILLSAIVGGISLQRVRKVAQPPFVTGTLRYWEIGKNPASTEEIDLTILGKHTLLIGSSAVCDVPLPIAVLASEHARVLAEKSPTGTDVYLEPLAEVRRGYSLEHVRFMLRHGETFRMGAHEFQYLSDHGE